MKKYLLILLTPLLVFAQTYMAKLEPYDSFTIYSQTSGQIIKLDKNKETKFVKNMFIKLDDSLEKKQLKIYKKQLALYEQKLNILNTNYKKYIKIKGKSQSDKDDKLTDLLDLKISIQTLKSNINTMEDTILKKNIKIENLYIKKFNVNQGDYVSTGASLASAYDISKVKLVVYVSSEDIKDIKNKKILLDGKKSKAKIQKQDLIVDETYVSAYKVTILLNEENNKQFGKTFKVEFIK